MAKLDYHSAGVNYDVLDVFKVACQQAAGKTARALEPHGFSEAENVRGESAYFYEAKDCFTAHVEEALGTKILVADAMYALTGVSYYQHIAIDNVATIVNDLVSCGALPVSLAMYAAVGDAEYLADETRAKDLAAGMAEACARSGAAWGGGETQVLKGMVHPETCILGGSATGRIAPKSNRITGDIHDGDVILCLGSSGVQTNGLTLCRALADRMPEGYRTKLADDRSYGEALLDASVIYVKFVAGCQQAGIPLHYAVHMTGHGWRKLMRLDERFVYHIDTLPTPQPVFDLIRTAAELDQAEMYGTYNMGVGFAVYVAPDDAERCLRIARDTGYDAWRAGVVRKEGDRKAVVLEPLGVTYDAESLKIR
jgi:phosphoribosylformylglycinamidine cyclo-ligase